MRTDAQFRQYPYMYPYICPHTRPYTCPYTYRSLAAAKYTWTDAQFRQYQEYLQQERVLQGRLHHLQLVILKKIEKKIEGALQGRLHHVQLVNPNELNPKP